MYCFPITVLKEKLTCIYIGLYVCTKIKGGDPSPPPSSRSDTFLSFLWLGLEVVHGVYFWQVVEMAGFMMPMPVRWFGTVLSAKRRKPTPPTL